MNKPKLPWQKIIEFLNNKDQLYEQLYDGEIQISPTEVIDFHESVVKDLNYLIGIIQEYIEHMIAKNYDEKQIIQWKEILDSYKNRQKIWVDRLKMMYIKADTMN